VNAVAKIIDEFDGRETVELKHMSQNSGPSKGHYKFAEEVTNSLDFSATLVYNDVVVDTWACWIGRNSGRRYDGDNPWTGFLRSCLTATYPHNLKS